MLLSLLSVCLVARQQLQQLKRRRRRRGEYGFIRILQAIAFMSEIKKRRVNVKKLELALATTTAVTKTMVKIAAVAVMTKSHGAMEGSVHHGTKGGWRRVQHLQGTQTPHLLTHSPPPKKTMEKLRHHCCSQFQRGKQKMTDTTAMEGGRLISYSAASL